MNSLLKSFKRLIPTSNKNRKEIDSATEVARLKVPTTAKEVVPAKSPISPISELWNEAYQDLRKTNAKLVEKYEERLELEVDTKTLPDGDDREEQMKILLKKKLGEKELETRNKLKIPFGDKEFTIAELIAPVIGVIGWANEYVGDALSPSPYASIAWAGLLLNPSKQEESLASGLDYTWNLIFQSTIRDVVYRRQLALFDNNSNALVGFRDTLKHLYMVILKFQVTSIQYDSRGTFMKIAGDTFKYDDWSVLLDDIKTKEVAFKKIFNSMKDVTDEEEYMILRERHQEYMNKITSIGIDMSTLRKDIELARNDAERTRLLHWLSDIDPSEIYRRALDKHNEYATTQRSNEDTGQTGDWLLELEHFKRWQRAPDSLLWLHGKAGSGKTVLLSTVIKYLKDFYESDPLTAIGYFYFSFNSIHSHTEMLYSLIKQLCYRRPDTPECVRSLLEYPAIGHRPDSAEIEETLLATIHGFSNVFIIIDALDECPVRTDDHTNHRAKLLRSLERIQRSGAQNLHLLCTSRPELDIETTFRSLLSRPRGTSEELDLSKFHPQLDDGMGLYIDNALASLNWPREVKEKTRAKLIEKADGMFQYVNLQLDALKDLRSAAAIEKSLKTLPEGLNAVYDRILQSIEPQFQGKVLNCLKWLAYSLRPLSLEEVAEVFALKEESSIPEHRLFEPEDVLKYLGSLVHLSRSHYYETTTSLAQPPGSLRRKEGVIVSLAHISIRDYLTSSEIQKGKAANFCLQETNGDLHLAESCLILVHLENIINVKSNQVKHVARFPLSNYALHYWAKHLEQVDRTLWTPTITKKVLKALGPSSPVLLQAAEMFCSPLTYTVYNGFSKLSGLLLDEGADPNERSANAGIETALCKGDYNAGQLLLERVADMNAFERRHDHKFDALQEAAYHGHADVVPPCRSSNINHHQHGGGSALLAAIIAISASGGKDFSIIELLLDHKADVNFVGGDAGNALACAAKLGNLPVVQLLLDRKADVNLVGGEYGNALQAAASERESEIVQLLLDKDADVNLQGGKFGSALQAAVASMPFTLDGFDPTEFNYDTSTIQLLLRKGADVNARGGLRGTALQEAIYANSVDAMQLLITAGADANLVGGVCGSALQMAVCLCWSSYQPMRLLLSHRVEKKSVKLSEKQWECIRNDSRLCLGVRDLKSFQKNPDGFLVDFMKLKADRKWAEVLFADSDTDEGE